MIMRLQCKSSPVRSRFHSAGLPVEVASGVESNKDTLNLALLLRWGLGGPVCVLEHAGTSVSCWSLHLGNEQGTYIQSLLLGFVSDIKFQQYLSHVSIQFPKQSRLTDERTIYSGRLWDAGAGLRQSICNLPNDKAEEGE